MNYLPHILRDVAKKVSGEMQALKSPFEVFFVYGLYQEVSNILFKEGSNTYPLIALIMPFDEQEGSRNGVQADVSFDMILANKTDPNWTMEEREEYNFFPVLFPMYYSLLGQLSKDPRLQVQSVDQLSRKRRILPYWGGDETRNVNNPNLATHYVDAIQVKEIKLSIRKQKC